MNVGNYSTRDIITTQKDCSIFEAARLMREHHVGSLIVVIDNQDEPGPVGIVTDRDIVIEVLAEGIMPDTVTVNDIMTPTPVVAREQDDIISVLNMMEERGVRRIPVMNVYDELTGILSTDDMLKFFHHGLGKIVGIYNREIANEKKMRN